MTGEFPLRALGDRCVVRADEPETMTSSGLFIPGSVQKKSLYGTVVEVPNGHWCKGKWIATEFAVGDRVVFQDYGGSEIKVNGEVVLWLFVHDILAKVSKERVLKSV